MASIGPTLEKPEDISAAIKAGAHWFRLPCGYRQRPHAENSRTIRAAAAEMGATVHLLLDMPSSRPRTGPMEELKLSIGDQVVFWDSDSQKAPPVSNGTASAPLPGLERLIGRLEIKQGMWYCDGRLKFVIEEVRDGLVRAILREGVVPLKASNSVFLPDTVSAFSVLTQPDYDLWKTLTAVGVKPDWLALSLIDTPEDVRKGRAEALEHFGAGIKIMAKFETKASVARAAEIIHEADAIMVARGDLGLAVGYAHLPGVQEDLVQAAHRAGKPVVVATQILEGFAENGIPLRAELSDLALMARQQATVIMLAKETVFSRRPIECIRLAREVMDYETQRLQKRTLCQEVPV